jgi:hypothetical protein
MIKSFSKRLPPGALVLIFLLTIIQSQVAFSQETQAGRQEVLRQASLQWMQVGEQQYKSKEFVQAEQSFRRALVFQKYLTDDERNQLNELLANTRKVASEGLQAGQVTQTAEDSNEPDQPATNTAVKGDIKADQPPVEAQPKPIKKIINKIKDQPDRQNVQPVTMAEPSVSNIQLTAESQSDISDIVVTEDEDFNGKLMQISDWLEENRRNILIIGLPVLAVLIVISRFQSRKRKPGRRVYENPAIAGSSSFIGARLDRGRKPKRRDKFPKTRVPVPAPVAPSLKQGGFTQSMEHWRNNAIKSHASGKSFETGKVRPQRKDKFETADADVVDSEHKQCSKCKKLKPFSEFYKNKSTSDGLARWCKECKSEYRKNHKAVKK